jgi:hypothetical protein
LKGPDALLAALEQRRGRDDGEAVLLMRAAVVWSRLADQASLTVAAAASLPSASNALATMPLASSPALAYIAAGES